MDESRIEWEKIALEREKLRLAKQKSNNRSRLRWPLVWVYVASLVFVAYLLSKYVK